MQDTSPQLVENGLRMLLQLLTSWKNGEPANGATNGGTPPPKADALAATIRGAEALGLVMLCQCKAYPRRLAVHVLRYKYLLGFTFRTTMVKKNSCETSESVYLADFLD